MASSKEIPHSSRPVGPHRLSMTNGSLPVRTSHSRHHSHSVSLGSLNPTHRVSRRKSVSTNATNVAAVAAAAKEAGDNTTGISMPITSRRNTMSRAAGGKGVPTPPSSLPTHRMSMIAASRRAHQDESAIDDDINDDDMDDDEVNFNKARMRRASEGQQLTGKKPNTNDLRCEKCGKHYKHSSCLTKHLWEHTPEWSFTSKLLISKHQQVQLLEAASVLVTMNQDGSTPPDSAKDFQSDQDSASPAESGSSAQHDGLSSADTTPPPQVEGHPAHSYTGNSFTNSSKRYSSGNSFSRSYQSAPSANLQFAGSAPNGSGFGQYHQRSSERRPIVSGVGAGAQEDEADLAAAVGLLSCSFGTPRSGPVTLPPDIPPVPPLPARYQSYQAQGVLSGSGSTLTPNLQMQGAAASFARENSVNRDVKMEDSEESIADDEDYDSRSRSRSDEDDDGVFGRMEE